MPGKILVFEELLRQLPSLFIGIEQLGLSCVRVENGRDVIPGIREHVPGVIILDVFMPQMSGLELCRQIKSFDPPLQGKIVLISPNASASIAQRAADFGCDLFLVRGEGCEEKILEFVQKAMPDLEAKVDAGPPPPEEMNTRNQPRFEISGVVGYAIGGLRHRGEFLNASMSGVLWAAPEGVAPGTHVNLEIEAVSGESFEVRTTVVRFMPLKEPRGTLKYAVGGKFDEMPPAAQERLQALLDFRKKAPPTIDAPAIRKILDADIRVLAALVAGGDDTAQLRTYLGTPAPHEIRAFQAEGPVAEFLKNAVLLRTQATAFQMFVLPMDADRKTLAPVFLPVLSDFLARIEALEDSLDSVVRLGVGEGEDDVRRGLNETANRLHEAKLRLHFSAAELISTEGLLPVDRSILEAIRKRSEEIKSLEKISPELLRLERRTPPKPEPRKEEKKKKGDSIFGNRRVQVTVAAVFFGIMALGIWSQFSRRVAPVKLGVSIPVDRVVQTEDSLSVYVVSIDWGRLTHEKKVEFLDKLTEFLVAQKLTQASIYDEKDKRVAAIASAQVGRKRQFQNKIYP